MEIEKKDLEFFVRGEFRAANELPLKAVKVITEELVELQEQLGLQMNSLMTMYRDGRTGDALGFHLVNYRPHGIDCKHEDRELFLEVKSIDWNEQYKFNATVFFKHTNTDKIAAFRNKRLFLATSVWGDANDLMFIIFGQNKEVGLNIQKQFEKQSSGKKSNSQKLKLMQLINFSGFKVIAINRSKEDVVSMLDPDNKNQEKWNNIVIDVKDFNLNDFIDNTNNNLIDEDLEWFHTGDFLNTTKDDFKKICDVMDFMSIIQNLYDLKHTETLFNIYHDSITGQLLGFDTMNIGGGGADCKMNDNSLFLEVKSMQWNDLGITSAIGFSDCVLQKAEAFKDRRLYLASSVWKNVSELMFIIVGQNSALGNRMTKAIQNTKNKCMRISLSTLIKQYGFKIIPISMTKDELIQMIDGVSEKVFDKDNLSDSIITLEDFNLSDCVSTETSVRYIEELIGDKIKKRKSLKTLQKEMLRIERQPSQKICELYSLLYELSKNQNGIVQISTRDMAKRLNWGKSTVQRILQRAINLEIIEFVTSGGNDGAIYKVSNIETFRSRVLAA